MGRGVELDDLANALARKLLGKSFEEATHLQSTDESLRLLKERILSKHTPRILGTGSDDTVPTLTEEDREANIHILGMPGEGKSKFLELLIRGDIDRLVEAEKQSIRTGKEVKAPGLCLLDPSDNGDTVMKVLKYCAHTGYKKVVVIDPYDMYQRRLVPCLNPFQNRPFSVAKNLFMDTIQNLWGSDWESNPRIRKYVPALLKCLYYTGHTLAETKWFMSDDKEYAVYRERILDKQQNGKYLFHPMELDRKHLERAYKDRFTYESFQSTINRLNPVIQDMNELMLGSVAGIDFQKMISCGYVLLVVLDSGSWGREVQKFLGTLIINELIYTREFLLRQGYTIPYYLYIDEVGQYATPKLTEIMDYKRKINLRLCVAHQRWDQIKDKDLASALYGGSARIHVLFNTGNPDDRMKMVKLMYGGELADRDVSYHLKDMAQRHCVIKINKQEPMKIRLKDIPDAPVSQEELKHYKDDTIYNLSINPYYRTMSEVREEINNRFVYKRTTKGPESASDRETRHHAAGAPQEPAGNVSNSPVQSSPVDDQKGHGGNGTPPVDTAEAKRPKRQAGLVPPKLPKRKQDSE